MEYFFRHHQRAVKTLPVVIAILLAAALESAAFSADQATSQSSSASLDFANGLYARKMYGPAIAEYEKFLKTSPESPDAASARFRYADSFYFSKDYAAAIAHFDVFLKKFPQDKRVELANFRLGTARYYQGDRARAIRSFVKLSKQASDPLVRHGSLFYLAKCLEAKNKTELSLRILQKLIQSDPKNEYASYAGVAIGDHYLKNDNLKEALSGYAVAANNTEPADLTRQARFKVAEIHFNQKNYLDAAAAYQKVYGESTTDPLKDKALLGLFYCDYYTGNLAGAVQRLASTKPVVESSTFKEEVLFLVASLYADNKNYDESLKKLDEITSSLTSSEELREKAQFKKIAVLSESGRKEESLAELEKYFGAGKKSQDKALFEKGQLYAEIGKTDEALAALGKVIQDYPSSEFARSALYQSALVMAKADRRDEAKKTFADYAARYATDANADLALLQIVQIDLDAKNFSGAFENVESFIKNHPNSEKLDFAYYKLGVAAAGLGRFGHAAFAFQKIIEKFPSSKLTVEAMYGAAVSLENARKLAEAIALDEQLLRDYPEHPLSTELRPRLGYLYIQNNDAGKALTYYEDLIFNQPKVPLETDGVFWLVQYLLDQGLYDRLDRILEKFETRFPEKDLKHEKYFFQGESAMGQKDYNKAGEFYQKSIDASKEGTYTAHSYLGRGIALAMLSQDAEAEQCFSEALKYDHELKVAMRARFELANLELKAKRLDEAAKGFMMVTILYEDPKYSPAALYKAGECYRALGKIEDADKVVLELKTKYPESEWAKKI